MIILIIFNCFIGSKWQHFHCISSISRLVKTLLKTTRNKKKKQNKIAMLARSKLKAIESKISEALMHNVILLYKVKKNIR